MKDIIAVEPPKTCWVQTEDGDWHEATLTHWWQHPSGRWEGCVVAPVALQSTVGVWVPATRLRPRNGDEPRPA